MSFELGSNRRYERSNREPGKLLNTPYERGQVMLTNTQVERPDVQPWRRALLVMIIVSLLCAPVSWVDDGITPSWVVYPIALIIALWRYRSGHGALFVAIAALVFLIVHLPWSWAAITGAEHNPLDHCTS
jgi:hypothetical protein